MARQSMSWRAVLGAILAATLVLLAVAQYYLAAQPISPEELARRCQQATPAWTNYDEDIKAQIGARPFAEWRGEPVSAYRDDHGLAIGFIVDLPWSGREAALPILIRDSLGRVRRDADWRRDGGLVVYRFPYEDDEAALLFDSVDVRYPHQTRRLLVIDRRHAEP